MKFVMLSILSVLNLYAVECSDSKVELMGAIKYWNKVDNRKVKLTKNLPLKKSWNVNSNYFHELVLVTTKKIDEVEIIRKQCIGCKKEVVDKKSFKVKKDEENYVASKLKLYSFLSSELLYPAEVLINVKASDKLICGHKIKLERIK